MNLEQSMEFVKSRWRPLMYASLFVLTVILSVMMIDKDQPLSINVRAVGVGVLAVMLVAVFVDLFTAYTKEQNGSRKQIRHWMVFSYTFMLFALCISILPFLTHDDGIRQIRPIMAFKGCVTGASVAKELSCDRGYRQWLVSIGSKVVNVEGDEQNVDNQAPSDPLPDNGKNLPTSVGGQGTAKQSFEASGGLVVPLYVIIVSLMGAAISLTRRIPEIQKHGSMDYMPTEDEPALTPLGVRERLVFQIVQFISAPLLAIVAYQLVESSTVTTSVLIAFVAGFSSESVLIMIRAMFDKIQPDMAKEPVKGSISGLVWNSMDNSPLAGARISVVGQSDNKSLTDERGFFALNGVFVGEQVVEAVFNDCHGMAKVSTRGCETTECHIAMSCNA